MSDTKLRIFISSVQKELDPERSAISGLISSDPFLLEHCEAILFDKEPISGKKASKPYLDLLGTCQIYLLLINREYGRPQGDLSATHHEYRHAQIHKLPTLVFVKGSDDHTREPRTREFFAEIKKDHYTYKRFVDRLDLRVEVRAAIIKLLKEDFNLSPSANEAKSGAETLEASSSFESRMTDASIKDLDIQAVNQWLKNTGALPAGKPVSAVVEQALRTRGLMWHDQKANVFRALASGIVFFGKNPAIHFPQCKVMLDAYKGNEIDPRPLDQDTLSLPAPVAIERVIEFVQKNTRHPPVIKGIRRIMLDEYPEKAVREAVVNAIAHRDYEDGSRNIMVAIYHDRIVVASPGFPPKPLTIAKIMKGKYLPCSRNPVIAQSLASLGLMEQRGSGMGRMRAAMLDHGLDGPRLEMGDGYFQVILPGPGEDLKRLRVPESKLEEALPASLLETLNKRQQKILEEVAVAGVVTSGWCREFLGVTYDTANRDLLGLSKAGLLIRIGKGRASRFLLKKYGKGED
jgi:predicted HTH transcriptional regulator